MRSIRRQSIPHVWIEPEGEDNVIARAPANTRRDGRAIKAGGLHASVLDDDLCGVQHVVKLAERPHLRLNLLLRHDLLLVGSVGFDAPFQAPVAQKGTANPLLMYKKPKKNFPTKSGSS